MASRELHYHWEYDLKASPEKLWPFAADTNRFNRDTGVPSVAPAKTGASDCETPVAGCDFPCTEWPLNGKSSRLNGSSPARFGVARTYSKGPITEMRALAELTPRADGGTKLTYDVRVKPRSLVGALLVSLQFKFSSERRFASAFRKYDEIAGTEVAMPAEAEVELDQATLDRLQVISAKLIAAAQRRRWWTSSSDLSARPTISRWRAFALTLWRMNGGCPGARYWKRACAPRGSGCSICNGSCFARSAAAPARLASRLVK